MIITQSKNLFIFNFNEMKDFLKKIGWLFLLFCCLFFITGFYLDFQFRKDISDKFIWLKNKKNNNYDYAFIGSSRTLNVIDISLMDSVLSMKGINLGMGGADYRTLYLILYTFVEIQKNNVDELYILVDPSMLYKDSVYNKPVYDHYFYDYVYDENVTNCLTENNRLFLYRFFPIYKYVEFNNVYNLTHFIRSFSKNSKWEKSKGSSLLYSDIVLRIDAKKMNKNKKQYLSFNNDDKKYLLKIIAFCKANNIRPIFYDVPIYGFKTDDCQTYPNYKKDIFKFAKQQGVTYFNFIEDEYDIHFYKDKGHMNYKGTVIFTQSLIDARLKLQEN